MSTNSSTESYQTTFFTTISEILIVVTNIVALVLNLFLFVCLYKVHIFTRGLWLLLASLFVAGAINTLGAFGGKALNLIARMLEIDAIPEWLCDAFHSAYSVGRLASSYQLVTLALCRLYVLNRMKHQQSFELPIVFYWIRL